MAVTRKSRNRKHRRFSRAYLKSRGRMKPRHRLKSGRTGTAHFKKRQAAHPAQSVSEDSASEGGKEGA